MSPQMSCRFSCVLLRVVELSEIGLTVSQLMTDPCIPSVRTGQLKPAILLKKSVQTSTYE